MTRMPFGKHKGRTLDEVPDAYLWWCLDNLDLWPLLREAIERRLGLEPGGQAPPPTAQQQADHDAREEMLLVARAWYRSMCLRFHPDRGGSNEAMKALNEANLELIKLIEQKFSLGGRHARQ